MKVLLKIVVLFNNIEYLTKIWNFNYIKFYCGHCYCFKTKYLINFLHNNCFNFLNSSELLLKFVLFFLCMKVDLDNYN